MRGEFIVENDKFQDFIADQFAKMFKEFERVKDDVSRVKDDVSRVKDDVSRVESIQLRMENDLNAKLLHEFVKTQRETNKGIVERLDRIEKKVEVLQLETAHVRKVK